MLIKYKDVDIPRLVTHLRDLQKRLQKATINMPDPDAPVLVRMNGAVFSGRQRLEMINSHWANHMAEIQRGETL